MSDEAGEWDFYYCRVDDAPASIFLNFALRESRPAGLDTLYYAGLEILVPGDHGMGEEPDVAELWTLEDAITDAAAAVGFEYVGRLRNKGDWQLTFYGKAGREADLEQVVVNALGDSERGYRTGEQLDAEWDYFEDFLLPDAERWQWIMDRRVVQQLAEAGDLLAKARPVDHFVHFRELAPRDAFMEAARKRGFSAEAGASEESAEMPLSVQLVREDPVDLDHIHEVVMDLIELADEHGGDYDGWGAPIAAD